MTLRNHENKTFSDYHDRIPALLARFKTVTAVAEHLGFKKNTAYFYLGKHPELLPAGGLPRTRRTLADHYASIPKLLLRFGNIAETAKHLGFSAYTLHTHLKAHPELVPPNYRRRGKKKDNYGNRIKKHLARHEDIARTAKHLGIKTVSLRRHLRTHPELLPPGMTLPYYPANRRFTDEQLLALLEKKLLIKEIAAILKVNPNSVYVRINTHDTFARYRPVPRRGLDPITIPPERMNELLRNNTMKKTAEILGVPPGTLYNFFARRPERRPSFLPTTPVSRYDRYRKKITALLEETKNISETARRLGVSVNGLWTYLKTRPELFPAGFPKHEKGPRLDRIAPGAITELLGKQLNQDTARQLGVSQKTLSKYLKLHPELIPEHRHRKWRRTKNDLLAAAHPRITQLLATTKTVVATAAALGVTVQRLAAYLKTHPELVPPAYLVRGKRRTKERG